MAPIRSALLAAVASCLAIAAAGCSSGAPARSRSPTSSASENASIRSLGARYLAIAEPANHRLDVEVAAYAHNAHHNLAAAEQALRAEAATEHNFDQQLAAISFPPAIEATAHALIRVNEIRVKLTLKQAAAHSIPALLSFTATHNAADAELEAQVRFIRSELGLPPPETS
jgi:hypothetical protein